MPEALFFKAVDNKLFIKAVGHITAALCADLRELVSNKLQSASAEAAIYVDLSNCDYMDSTFLGLLVGFNKWLIKAGADRLTIVNPSEPAKKLLMGLSLFDIVTIADFVSDFPCQMDSIQATVTSNSKLILNAHEHLMELSEENRQKFKTLHSLLKQQSNSKNDLK